MRIGVYFDSRRMRAWNWKDVLSGDTPVSGTDGQVFELSAYLQAHGFEVHFYSQHPGDDCPCYEAALVKDLSEASEASKRGHLDVLLFVNHGHPETIDGMRRCEAVRQPAIAWDQNGPDAGSGRVANECSYIRRLVCVSFAQANGARDQRVFQKIAVIHNSLAPRSFVVKPPPEGKRMILLYAGSLTPSKGFHHLARVWQKVRNGYPAATLIVAGSGRLYDRSASLGPLGIASPEYESLLIPYVGKTRLEAAEHGIEFRGLLSQNAIRDLAAEATVGVVNPNPSGSIETFCVSAVEMQAAGLPVVGARAGGLNETILDGKTGFLVRNEADLANRLGTLLGNPALAKKMGAAAQGWVQRSFGRRGIGAQWSRLIYEAAANAPNAQVPLRLRGLDYKIAGRECMRRLQLLPWPGDRLPPFSILAERVRRKFSLHEGRHAD